MKLRELVAALPASPHAVTGNLDREVTALVADSRQASPGAFFFALPGSRTDGRRFVAEAIERGAEAVAAPEPIEVPEDVAFVEVPEIYRAMSAIAAAFYGHPSRHLRLVGVTGTNGKTTTTYLLESIWRADGRTPGVIGTINYRIGDRSWPAPFTTPQAIDLQRLLAEMVGAGATDVAMEVSSHALALDRVRDCEWDGAVFTNLTRDHLDFHPDMESYFEAKARLFTELLPASKKPERFAVVNADDDYGRKLAERMPVRLVRFGRENEADVSPGDVHRTLDGLRGEIRAGSGAFAISTPLVGDSHLANVLAAAAVTYAQGIELPTIARGIDSCAGVPGRMERVDDGRPFAVFVDYAHTPDALERSIRTLRRLTDGRVIAVFGCGGDRDRGKRPVMGEIAARLADLVILTSDNPRTEDPVRILHEIESGVREAGLEVLGEGGTRREGATGYFVEPDRRRAIRLATSVARAGDAVLIAGKGHEPYQQIGDQRFPFDDREEARQSLGKGAAA